MDPQIKSMMLLEFQQRLCTEMKLNNIRASELARLCGLSPDAVGPLMHGKHLPSVPTLAKLSLELVVSTDYLLGLSDER